LTQDYPKKGRSPDEHDAYSVGASLSEIARRDTLDCDFEPPLRLPDSRTARLEKAGFSASTDEIFSRKFAVQLRNTAEFQPSAPN
jgi:hypothetical protein